MSLKDWIDHMLGRAQQRHDEETRQILDSIEAQQVDTLAVLTGRTPDQVRADADRSRRGRLLQEAESYRRSR